MVVFNPNQFIFNAFLKQVLLGILLLLFPLGMTGQRMDVLMPKEMSRAEIPFQKINNFIVVNVAFNGQFPMRFILDTGARYTVLTKKELISISKISYLRTFSVYGADRSQPFTAYLAPNIEVDIGQSVFKNMPVLVMEEDYLQLEEFIGTDIHGIIGMDFFRNLVLEINYQQSILTITKPDKFTPKNHLTPIPFELTNHRPYLNLDLVMQGGKKVFAHLLIDTGADLSLLIHPNSNDSIVLPENIVEGRIGNGLGGFLHGYLGRVAYLDFPLYPFKNVVTHFQDMPHLNEDTTVFSRNGLIGSRLLSRFLVTFDFARSNMYLSPVRNYDKDFKYDRSGLFLLASGLFLKEILVVGVIKDSPAWEVGIREGDLIRRINGNLKVGMTINIATQILQKKAGKKIRLVIERDGVKTKKIFYLKDLI